jgi:hypothetical protein
MNDAQKKPTLAEATYRNTLALRKLLEPIKTLAEAAQETEQASPFGMMLNIMEQSQESDRKMIERLDQIISLLAAPSIEKAINDMMKG